MHASFVSKFIFSLAIIAAICGICYYVLKSNGYWDQIQAWMATSSPEQQPSQAYLNGDDANARF